MYSGSSCNNTDELPFQRQVHRFVLVPVMAPLLLKVWFLQMLDQLVVVAVDVVVGGFFRFTAVGGGEGFLILLNRVIND